MDVFNKLKSAVSSALPGNPLAKDFEVFGLIATAGPGLLWKVYHGVKKTTKQDAAIFVFEKKSIEKYSKRDKDMIVDCLRRGASQLTRLRHPKILSVLQPLEESREGYAFATEPVLASLANILGNHDGLPDPVVKLLQEHTMYEMEIKYGFLQVIEAIQFLHQDVKLLHNNICPASVFINKNGSWKLAGFDFCIANTNPPEHASMFPFKKWDPEVAPCAQPNLDYMAPENVITESCSLACDMFSIGILVYSIFNNGKTLYECNNQLSGLKRNAEELKKWRGSLLGKIPEELHDIVKLLLNTDPTVRPDPFQLSKIHFFEDVGSMTLQYMDSLFQQDNLQKSKFFKGLPKIIVKFPKRVNLQRILPPLFKECVNPDMIPFVLPNVLQIAEQLTDKEYTTYVFPELIPMFKITTPIQILLIFVQNMNLLLKKTPAGDIKAHVLPMIYRALESENPEIQELCLNIIPTFADLMDYTSLKNAIVPRIKKLCLGATITRVCVNCLLCLGSLLEIMDKWFVLDEVLPLMPQIASREPAVLMSILGVYKVAFTHAKLGITKDMLAMNIIPFLVSISIDHNLNLEQFKAYMHLIKEMITKVETEQCSKLEQLQQMKQEQKNLEITRITEHDNKTLISGIEDGKSKTMMETFLSGISSSPVNSGGKENETRRASSVTQQTTMGSQPSKVTLSLEEKQRLAKEQEQQSLMKAQKPLQAKVPLSSQQQLKTGLSQPKDLTSTLMNSNLMGLSSSSQNSGSLLSSVSNGPNMSAGVMRLSQPSMNTLSPLSPPAASLMQQSSNISSFGGQTSVFSQHNKPPVDLSSFDSLISHNSNRQVKPLNQIQLNKGASSMQQAFIGNAVNQEVMGGPRTIGAQMVGNQNFTGSVFGGQNLNVMNANAGFGDSQSISGFQHGGMGSNSGFQQVSKGSNFAGQQSGTGNNAGFQLHGMGNQALLFPCQPIGGPSLSQQQLNVNQQASNSIDDLLG